MIRYKGEANGRPMIGLGLTAANLERLMDNDPVFIKKESMDLPFDIVIHYGRTIPDLLRVLKDAGVDLPEPTPGPEHSG